MMATTETVKQQLAKRQRPGHQAPPPARHGHTLLDVIERMRPQIARALPSMISPDRFVRIALTTLRQNPRLMECTPESVLGALMISAQLGLEPGPLGHCWLIPFRDRKRRTVECQWILGYTGIIDLARRSGEIASIQAREVYHGDHFDYIYGLEERLEHRPAEDDRGDFRGAYVVARYHGGGHNLLWLPRTEIEKHRARSKSPNDGPWVTDYDAMARKTAVRAVRPYLPMSVEMREAFAADENAALWSPDDPEVIDIGPQPQPEKEGEEGDGTPELADSDSPDGGAPNATEPEPDQPESQS